MATVKHDSDVRVGALIAGGASRRAGVDKRYLVLEGQTLLARDLAFLHGLFPKVAVVVGRGQQLDIGDDTTVDVLEDAWPGSSPLVGIATALAHYRQPVFAMAADVAFPHREAALAVLAAAPGHDASLPAIGRDWRQPLFAVYGPCCLAPMAALLSSDRHRILDALTGVSVAEVRFPDDSVFHNINTMDDYREARRRARLGAAPPRPPGVVAIVGRPGAGRTTLIGRLVAELTMLGLHVGTVERVAQGLELDRPPVQEPWPRDQDGTEPSSAAAPRPRPSLTRLASDLPLVEIARLHFAGFDLVVSEGFQATASHRVETFRRAAGHARPLLAPKVLALVRDTDLDHPHRFALDDASGLARFLAQRLDALREY